MLQGLPASGKSTIARELVAKGWKRVNKDDIRDMIDNGKFSRVNEEMVKTIELQIAIQFLDQGFNVVVDDTNFAYEKMWCEIAKRHGAEFKVQFVDTPIMECLARNALRGDKKVPEDAVWRMYRDYIQPKIVRPRYDVSLPDAFIFDIDGTLAHMKNRSPFAWDRVGEDSLDEYVAHVLDALKKAGRQILIVSGRDGSSLQTTIEWLKENNIAYDNIWMRSAKDNRKDSEVKKEIYENEIKGKYNVLGVFDDRDQVVELWRSLGLKVYQCEYGNF